MGSKTDYMENKVLELLRANTFTAPATVYSALFTVIPSDSSAGTEVTGATSTYTRVATTFATASNGATSNSGAVTFATMAASVVVVGWGLMDASTVSGAGNMLYWATVATLTLSVGDQATFGVGGITISED